MQRHAVRTARPGALDGLRQHEFPQALACEGGQQPEIRNFHSPVVMAAQLEVAGRLSVDTQHPELERRVRQLARDVLVSPGQPIDPAILAADLGVEVSPERGRCRRLTIDADVAGAPGGALPVRRAPPLAAWPGRLPWRPGTGA